MVRAAGSDGSRPAKWKMFVVSLAATYVLQLACNLALGELGWVMPLRVGAIAVIVTFFMTWTVMPWMARVLQDWLYAPPGRH